MVYGGNTAMNPPNYTTNFPHKERTGRSRSDKFVSDYPDVPFTLQDIVQQNPSNNYQVIYQRLQHDLKTNKVVRLKATLPSTNRGAKRKLYQKIQPC